MYLSFFSKTVFLIYIYLFIMVEKFVASLFLMLLRIACIIEILISHFNLNSDLYLTKFCRPCVGLNVENLQIKKYVYKLIINRWICACAVTAKFTQHATRAASCLRCVMNCTRGTSILGEVRNVEISRVTQQLLCSKYHDFLAIFALAHSKINQIAQFLDDNVRNDLILLSKP